MNLIKAEKYIKENRNKVDETYRNKFHLMAPIGWMNDPNGFIYYKGQYHLFYQFYPYDSVWGPMHWGHSVSKDGVNWEELPTALAPDKDYDKGGCFSGTAYVENDILYLMYTGHVVENDKVRQVQCLAKSSDGIHFEKLKENPVISEEHIEGICSISDFRDPKLLKHTDKYYSIVAANTEDKRGQLVIFESNDMINWSKGTVFLEGSKNQGIMWECPDIFELDKKDVIIMSPIQMKAQGNEYTNISSTIAMIGKIDWENLKFVVENEHEIDRGLDFYAPQSALNGENQRIITAWMQMWDRTNVTHELKHNWSGSMTLPREVNIVNNRLVQKPIRTVYDNFHIEKVELNSNEKLQVINEDIDYINLETSSKGFDIRLAQDDHEFVSLVFKEGLLVLSRANSGHEIVGSEGKGYNQRSLEITSDSIEIEAFIDTSSVEVFINKENTMSMTFYKEKDKRSLSFRGLDSKSNLRIGRFK